MATPQDHVTAPPAGAQSDEDPLYRGIVIDHYASPRNRGRLPAPDGMAHVKSDMCGDELLVTVALEGSRIRDLRYEGEGCAISQALASIGSERYVGMLAEEVLGLDEQLWVNKLLGAPVSSNRRVCAALHLRAIKAALQPATSAQ